MIPTTYKKREGEEIKIPNFPRSAADLQLWLDSVTNAVTSCAVNPDTSFEWIARTEDDDVDFEELGVAVPEFASLDAKLRTALTKNASSGLAMQRNSVTLSTSSWQSRKSSSGPCPGGRSKDGKSCCWSDNTLR